MSSIFCDSEGTWFVEFLKRGATVNTELCVQTLKKLRTSNSNVSGDQKDESRPHPLYSPDLAPSDFHLLGPMKDGLRGARFADTTS